MSTLIDSHVEFHEVFVEGTVVVVSLLYGGFQLRNRALLFHDVLLMVLLRDTSTTPLQ